MMTNQRRSIAVRTLPKQIDGVQRKALYRDLEGCINVDRPAVVFDCSELRQLDKPAIHFLLCCLEEAMKRNGDIRLAAPSQEAKLVMESTGIDLLFQTFESIGEALESFQIPQMSVILDEQSTANDQRASENAA